MNSERMEANYLDFELGIGLGVGREYPVSVINSPTGEAQETMHFPFDELKLENRLLALQNALLRSGGKRRRVNLPEEQSVQDFGRDLFEALLCGEVRSRYAVSLDRAARQGKGLRIKLHIKSPKLAALPWEFLFDQSQGEHLCLSTNTPVVRYVELPQTIQPLKVNLPLRILGMIADPSDLPSLDIEREKMRIEEAVKTLEKKGLVELTWLSGQTWRDLHRAMRSGPWHIFHFIGHGGFDADRDEGLICLSDEEGKKHLMSATQLGRLLADHAHLRFVLLNACEGARGSNRDIFSGSASILVQRGIPAVIAMQYEITDRAAVEFARTFYESLAEGLPIDTSTAEARKAVSLAVNNTLEWGTPVLYMRSPDGILFSMTQTPAVEKELQEVSSQKEEKSLPLDTANLDRGPIKDRENLIPEEPTPKVKVTPPDAKPVPATQEMPADVKDVKQKANKVYKNQKGYWEAEFDYGIILVYITAGEFTMGSNDGDDDEKPVHKVYLDGYWIGKYEVTFDQFNKYCDETGKKKPNDRGWGRGKRPVIYVSWDDATAYCEWLKKKTGLSFNLPTEAQWEKAARGTEGLIYPWGNKFDKNKCNSKESGLEKTSSVGKFPEGVSPYGCLDMAGNVWEWCYDWFDKNYYKKSPDKNPEGPSKGSFRVFRGGGWLVPAFNCRASYRHYALPDSRWYGVGFRLARSL